MSPFEEGLPAGEYIIMYQGEFTNEHPERKLIASIYADHPIELQMIDEKSYSQDKWENIDYAMYDMMQTYGTEADPPAFDSIKEVFAKGA